jgi:hypothetical protein
MPPFVRINGHTVVIEDNSVNLKYVDIGERKRAHSGKLLTDRRARKRVWTMKTTPVEEMVAKQIEALVAGLGDVYRPGWVDFKKGWGQDNFSTVKGVVPNLSVISGATRWGVAADGADVVDSVGVDESRFRNSFQEPKQFVGASYTNEATATNILLPNARDGTEDGTTGDWTAIGGSLSSSTAQRVQGLRSLLCTNGAAGQGAHTDNVSASPNTSYAASAYVFAPSSSTSVRIELEDDGGIIGGTTYVLPLRQWTRIHHRASTSGGATFVRARFTVIGNSNNFHVDAAQIETAPVGSIGTSWANPTRTLVSGLRFDNLMLGYQDFTINFWIKGRSANPSATENIVETTAQGPVVGPGARNPNFSISRPSGTGNVQFRTESEFGNVATLSASSIPGGGGPIFSDAWHMVTCLVRHNPEGAQNKAEMYFDGQLVASASGFKYPDFRHRRLDVLTGDLLDIQTFIGGSTSSVAMDEALVQDVMFLPYAATAQLISDWFNELGSADSLDAVAAGVAMSPLPRFYLDGDMIPDLEERLLVQGEIENESYLAASLDNTVGARTNLRRISLKFEEV